MKKNIFLLVFIGFWLALGLLPLNAQSYKHKPYQLIGDSTKFEVKWMGYYTDPRGTTSRVSLEDAKFEILTLSNKDRLMSFWEQGTQPKIWAGIIIRNTQNEALRMTIHTGNIEFCSFYGPNSWGGNPIYGGYLRAPLKSPEIRFALMPSVTDTFFISIENYVISPKDIRIFIGLTENIEQKKHDFREIENIGWFIFQCGFLFLFAFSLLNSIVNWFLLKRIEFIFYAMYLIVSILLFGALSIEAWVLSFASVIKPGVPTFTIFYLKGLFIVYSICYFKFFSSYLDIRKNDAELNAYTVFLEITQVSVVLLEIGLLFTNVSTELRFQIFAAMGGLLALIAAIYNIILFNKKSDLLKTPEVRLMNGLATLINFVMVPLTIYEMVWRGSLIGPVGIFFMQSGFLIEAACFNWTTTRKTIRIEKKSSEDEQQKNEWRQAFLESKNKALEKERELFNLRQELTNDFHDGMGDNIAKIILQCGSIIRKFGQENDPLKEKLEALKHFGKKIEDDYRLLLYLTDPRNDRLDILLDKIMATGRKIFENTEIKIDFNYEPSPIPLLSISARQHKHLFFFAKEALTNAFKHANAKNVLIYFNINMYNNELNLSINDDGVGFDSKQAQSGHGRTSLKQRAEAAGVTMQINSFPGKGTKISIQGPLDQA